MSSGLTLAVVGVPEGSAGPHTQGLPQPRGGVWGKPWCPELKLGGEPRLQQHQREWDHWFPQRQTPSQDSGCKRFIWAVIQEST